MVEAPAKLKVPTPVEDTRDEVGELPSVELLERRQEEKVKWAKETPIVATRDEAPIDVPDIAKRGVVPFTGNRKITEDSSTGREEASLGDEQGNQEDHAEGSREGQNEDPLGPIDSHTIEEGGQELGGQPSDIPEHPKEEPMNDPDRDQEGSTIRRSSTNIPDTSSMNAQGSRDYNWRLYVELPGQV
ncbi:hypothetical protein M9H77_14131 [Catharanthus roseus]|uniref:Uncharacterized protein n=1 Tax=Catharanthus roseus TaxID=4058 RepID=A0ACC0BMF4_CATRO|nr:hypothetical protein M9H77_14131 [Catharanthus roseus]